ncbi:MAG: Asp-tRNA(Asn)/Glu-tRNA(Gln) amidotransferase subunit GatC [Patescibacteria group bacterium]|nr:Asp-tRNA(Asn)/Glu-tRNA(Gln) amidotransferase subunit GatC [Patescibacteria group bacterium]
MELEDIKNLAQMARIDMSDNELADMASDFGPILEYVGQIGEVKQSLEIKPNYTLQNVVREDVSTNKTGEYTERIIEQMPDSQDGFLKVKQIL